MSLSRATGREFQRDGPAMEKLLSPRRVRNFVLAKQLKVREKSLNFFCFIYATVCLLINAQKTFVLVQQGEHLTRVLVAPLKL